MPKGGLVGLKYETLLWTSHKFGPQKLWGARTRSRAGPRAGGRARSTPSALTGRGGRGRRRGPATSRRAGTASPME